MRRTLGVLVLPLVLSACDPNDWLTDMKQQPSVDTWQKFSLDSLTGETTPFRGNPQGSVPVTGVTVAEWEVSYAPTMQAVDSLSRVPNPVEADARSLANGHRLYQVNCTVCHGELGDANSPMRQLSPNYGFAPAINGAVTAARSDGYLWGMLRNGRGLMANYNRISESERWDIVNYVRGLQGRYSVQTGDVVRPGEAESFSRVSPIAPTMPVLHVKPTTTGTVPRAPKPAEDDHGGH